jgi:cytochrome-b5 reductase
MAAVAAADGGRNDAAAAGKFTAEIKAFVASGEQEKAFPPTLTAEDRKIVHDICYELDLMCKSRGPKSNGRFITVFKPDAAQLAKLKESKKRALERKAAGGADAAAAAPAAKRQRTEDSSCFIGADFVPLELTGVVDYNHDSKIFEFGLPEGQSLNLPVCACILMKGKTSTGEDAVRPYTPVSDNSMLGKFQLLIKRYEEGVVSKYVHDGLKIGDKVEFKHIPFNVKIQHPFKAQTDAAGPVRTVSMLCGGTGIAPMYQALHKVLNDSSDDTVVTLLYGNRSESDILLRKELEDLAAKHPKQLKLHNILGASAGDPAPEGWTGEVGWIDEEKIKRLCPPPAADTLMFVCGVPALYTALCGPRGDKSLPEDTVLAKLGYTPEMVSKF